MRTDITREFVGATEKGLKVYLDETTGDFEVEREYDGELFFSIYDESNEAGDASNGEAAKAVAKFISEFYISEF